MSPWGIALPVVCPKCGGDLTRNDAEERYECRRDGADHWGVTFQSVEHLTELVNSAEDISFGKTMGAAS